MVKKASIWLNKHQLSLVLVILLFLSDPPSGHTMNPLFPGQNHKSAKDRQFFLYRQNLQCHLVPKGLLKIHSIGSVFYKHNKNF